MKVLVTGHLDWGKYTPHCDAPKPKQEKLPLQHLASLHVCSVCSISPSSDCIKHLANNSKPTVSDLCADSVYHDLRMCVHNDSCYDSVHYERSISCKSCKEVYKVTFHVKELEYALLNHSLHRFTII